MSAVAVLAHAVAHLDPTNVQDGDLAEGERVPRYERAVVHFMILFIELLSNFSWRIYSI